MKLNLLQQFTRRRKIHNNLMLNNAQP